MSVTSHLRSKEPNYFFAKFGTNRPFLTILLHFDSRYVYILLCIGVGLQCNACGVRMKKGRLAFTNGGFVAVESAAAAAKRLRASENAQAGPASASGGVSKPKRVRVTPKRLEGTEMSFQPGRWAANANQRAGRQSAPALLGRAQTPSAGTDRNGYALDYQNFGQESGQIMYSTALHPITASQSGYCLPHNVSQKPRGEVGTPVTQESGPRDMQVDAQTIRRSTDPSASFPRPLSRHQSATGLYSLLAAIDFIDGTSPVNKN